MSRAKDPAWFAFLAARWKAVAATVVPLIGGVLYMVSTGEFDIQHLAGFLAIALGAGGVTHVVPNATAPNTPDGIGASIGIDLPEGSK